MPKVLIGLEALNFVKKYVKVAESKEFAAKKPVLNYCQKFPCVLKLSSAKLIHKTEKSAVIKVVNKEHLSQVLKNFDKIKTKNCKYLVQEYIKGAELILGLKKDKSFGHVIVLGIGGVFVELIKDIQFRVCPITGKDAKDMISTIKSQKIFQGFRGKPKINKKKLVQSAVLLSKLAKTHPEIKELDINPLICDNKACKAADVRVVLEYQKL